MLTRLKKWIREADVVVWLLFALLVVGVLIAILIAIQRLYPVCITNFQLPTTSPITQGIDHA